MDPKVFVSTTTETPVVDTAVPPIDVVAKEVARILTPSCIKAVKEVTKRTKKAITVPITAEVKQRVDKVLYARGSQYVMGPRETEFASYVEHAIGKHLSRFNHHNNASISFAYILMQGGGWHVGLDLFSDH